MKNDLYTRQGDVHKLCLQEEGGRWSKKSTFCKLSYHRECKRRGVGGQKKTNLVNVVCECPLTLKFYLTFNIVLFLSISFSIKRFAPSKQTWGFQNLW